MKFYKDDRGQIMADYSSATDAELREENAWARRQCVLFSPTDPAYRGAMICLRRVKEEMRRRVGGMK